MTTTRHFVGRHRELAILEHAVAQAAAGRPQIVCVQGAAGIGKSALLQELVRRCGLRVLPATGSDDESRLPFGIIDQLLHNQTGRAGTVSGSAVATGWSDPMAAGAHLLSMLSAISGSGPVGLLVDDLHWVDDASAQAIAFMLRRLGHDRVIALFGSRADEGAPPDGLARLLAAEHGTVLTLTGLRRPELRQLAEALGVGAVPNRVLACVEEMTTGNPLHATAILEDLPLCQADVRHLV